MHYDFFPRTVIFDLQTFVAETFVKCPLYIQSKCYNSTKGFQNAHLFVSKLVHFIFCLIPVCLFDLMFHITT